MNRFQLMRALRITWTAFFGITCMLLCVLWLRSYAHWDVLNGTLIARFQINSFYGLIVGTGSWSSTIPWEAFEITTMSPQMAWQAHLEQSPHSFSLIGDINAATAPDWFFVVISWSLAAVPWIRLSKRFSVRTLLIAMSLIAVGFGIIIVLSR